MHKIKRVSYSSVIHYVYPLHSVLYPEKLGLMHKYSRMKPFCIHKSKYLKKIIIWYKMIISGRMKEICSEYLTLISIILFTQVASAG